MQEISEKLKSKIAKLKALAERGIDGEKETAAKMLGKLLEKHGITLAELEGEEMETHWFKFKGKYQKRVLSQVILSVVGSERDWWKNLRKRSYLGVDCTMAEKVEIELKSSAYLKAFEREIDVLVTAFINAHDLFPDDVEAELNLDLTEEEIEELARMSAIASGMSPVTVHQALPNHSN